MANVGWSDGSIGQAISMNNGNDLNLHSMTKLLGWLCYCLFYMSHFTGLECNSNNLDNGMANLIICCLKLHSTRLKCDVMYKAGHSHVLAASASTILAKSSWNVKMHARISPYITRSCRIQRFVVFPLNVGLIFVFFYYIFGY